jgi:hypothetical protein
MAEEELHGAQVASFTIDQIWAAFVRRIECVP